MKIVHRIPYTFTLIVLVSLLMLISGCGGTDESKDQGCPSDAPFANSTDIITGPLNDEITAASYLYDPFEAQPIFYPPVVFTVTDKDGEPRNNICLIVYTDGTLYTDKTYTTPVGSSGPVAVVTDDYGNAYLYWSTEVLPAAMPAMIIPPSTTPTAGSDQTGESFISVYSGVLYKDFVVKWTVEGEPTS